MWKKLVWIPAWSITFMMIPILPKTHPWKGRYLSLQSWADKGTPDAKILSLMIWATGVPAIVVGLWFLLRM